MTDSLFKGDHRRASLWREHGEAFIGLCELLSLQLSCGHFDDLGHSDRRDVLESVEYLIESWQQTEGHQLTRHDPPTPTEILLNRICALGDEIARRDRAGKERQYSAT